MKWPSLGAITSVAYKEFLHIYRDRRVLLLVIILPPFFTLIFGHAFENTQLTDVPALLIDRDQTPRTASFHRDHFQGQDVSLENAGARLPG